MNKNRISIIYGDNGDGKSLYYRDIIEKNKNEYLPFNYDIEKWYNPDNKTFSEFNLKGAKLTNKIFDLNKQLLEDIEKELNFKIDYNTFNNIIKSVSAKYHNVKKLVNYTKNNKKIENVLKFFSDLNILNSSLTINDSVSFLDVEIQSYIDTYEGNETYRNIFKSLYSNDTIFENICVYINLYEYKDVEFLHENEHNKKILEIKKTLEEFFYKHINENIKKEDREKIIEIIRKSNIEILNRIYRKDHKNWGSDSEKEIQLFILKKVINSKTFKNLLNEVENFDKLKKSCIKFINYDQNVVNIQLPNRLQEKLDRIKKNIQFSDDGIFVKNIDLGDKNVSNGEKIILIFSLFLSCFFKENKIIVFDDVFEKLDYLNSSILIRIIYNELLTNDEHKKEVEVLTHDINDVEQFDKIYNEESINDFLIFYPYIHISDQVQVELKGKDNTCLTFNFDSLLRNLKNSFINKDNNKQQYEENHAFITFCKLFNRNSMGNNWIQSLPDNDVIKIDDSYSIKIYQFISENIFHYSPEIILDDSIKKFFCEFNFESKCCKSYKSRKIDTVEFFEKFIVEITDKKPQYGIDFNILKDDIQNIKKFIELEKKFYESNVDNYKNRTSAQNFYKDFWNNNLNEKMRRNFLFHSFEKSLTKYRNKKY